MLETCIKVSISENSWCRLFIINKKNLFSTSTIFNRRGRSLPGFFLNQCTTQHKLLPMHARLELSIFRNNRECQRDSFLRLMCMFKLQPFQQNLIPTCNQRRMKFTCERSHYFSKYVIAGHEDGSVSQYDSKVGKPWGSIYPYQDQLIPFAD